MNNIFVLSSLNFGDGINKVFWEYITQNKIYNNRSELHYITTGSIMCLINNKSMYNLGLYHPIIL